MQFHVSGSSYVQTLNVHGAPKPLAVPASVGAADAAADRAYDNGYVRLDPGTLNPNAVGGMGYTWNWAYDSAGQYNATANTMALSKLGAPGYTSLGGSAVEGQDAALGAGLQLRGLVPLHASGPWTFSLAVGFQGIWGAESNFRMSTYGERISQLQVRDTYNVADAVHPTYGFPGPRTTSGGYAGTYDGPAGGASSWVGGYPVIGNIPNARQVTQQDLYYAQNDISFRCETSFYELTLSPRISYALSRVFTCHATPELGVAYVDVSTDRSEYFRTSTGGLLASWQDHASAGQFRFATGITGGVDADLGHGYYAGAYGGYEWVLEDVSLASGPNTISLNPSGFVAGLVLGKKF